jgi:ABC-2 type transport system permease protein
LSSRGADSPRPNPSPFPVSDPDVVMHAISAIGALWRREIIKFVRDRARLIGAILQPLGFWILLGLGFQGTFALPADVGSEMGFFEFLFPGIIALIVLFTAIFSTISIVEERKSGFLQGVLVSPVPRTSIVLGTTLGGTSLAFFEAALFLLFIPFLGLSLTIPGLAVILLATFLLGITFTALGVIIAWLMPTTRAFHAVMNLFLLPLWFLSGSFFPAAGAPAVLQWLIMVNPVSYSVSSIRHGLYFPAGSGLELAGPLVSLSISALFAAAIVGVAVAVVRQPRVA